MKTKIFTPAIFLLWALSLVNPAFAGPSIKPEKMDQVKETMAACSEQHQVIWKQIDEDQVYSNGLLLPTFWFSPIIAEDIRATILKGPEAARNLRNCLLFRIKIWDGIVVPNSWGLDPKGLTSVFCSGKICNAFNHRMDNLLHIMKVLDQELVKFGLIREDQQYILNPSAM